MFAVQEVVWEVLPKMVEGSPQSMAVQLKVAFQVPAAVHKRVLLFPKGW